MRRIERLERQTRGLETALFLQDRKLEDLKEVIRKRGEGIQAQNSRVDVLSQPTYQEIPVFTVTVQVPKITAFMVTSQDPN